MTMKPVRIEENGEREDFTNWTWIVDESQLPSVKTLVHEISSNAANVVLDQIKTDLSARVDINEDGSLWLSVNLFGECYSHFDLALGLSKAVEFEFFSDELDGLPIASTWLRALADKIDDRLVALRDK